MAEKRSHVRYPIRADINLKTEAGVSYSFKAGVANVSFRGVTIFSPEKIGLENKIVHFELMADLLKDPLTGKGIIKYVSNEEKIAGVPMFRMGLEFVDINKGTILHFLNRLQELRTTKLKRTHPVKKAGGEYLGAF